MRWVSSIVLLMLAGCRPDVAADGESGASGQTSTSESSGQGTSSTGDGDGDGDGDGPQDCGMVSIAPAFVPREVMLVVDTSRSMAAQTWDHDQDPATPAVSRWHSARELIDKFAAAMDGLIVLGVQLFPSADACAGSSDCLTPAACSISAMPEVIPSEDYLAALATTLPEPDATPQTLGGGSPAYAALSAAYEQLRTTDSDAVKVVFFVTDGLGNCSADTPFPATLSSHDAGVHDLVEQAFTMDQIVTLIVGIDVDGGAALAGLDAIASLDVPGSLDELAIVGGVPRDGGLNPDGRKFFLPSESDEILGLFLSDCTITDCVVDLSMTSEGVPAPEQLDLITVESIIDGGDPVEVPLLDAAACEQGDGWSWLLEGEIITMCGIFCDLFENGGAAFEIHYGCPLPN